MRQCSHGGLSGLDAPPRALAEQVVAVPIAPSPAAYCTKPGCLWSGSSMLDRSWLLVNHRRIPVLAAFVRVYREPCTIWPLPFSHPTIVHTIPPSAPRVWVYTPASNPEEFCPPALIVCWPFIVWTAVDSFGAQIASLRPWLLLQMQKPPVDCTRPRKPLRTPPAAW